MYSFCLVKTGLSFFFLNIKQTNQSTCILIKVEDKNKKFLVLKFKNHYIPRNRIKPHPIPFFKSQMILQTFIIQETKLLMQYSPKKFGIQPELSLSESN